MTTEDLIAYYQNLLTQQFQDRPRAVATIGALVEEAVASLIVPAMLEAFNVESAQGPQVDMLGQYRGVTRKIFGLNLNRQFMAFPSYDDANIHTVKGMWSYDDPLPLWFWLLYSDADQLTYELKDDEMLRLIKFRAACHGSTLGLGEVDDILYNFFGATVTLIDNHNMSIEYHQGGSDTLFDIAKQTNSFPRPAGVSLATTP